MSDEQAEGTEAADAQALLTASDVARYCQVDLKTVHNWAAKGRIQHFRTPGRHHRFRAGDVVRFLREYGYPVPAALRPREARIVGRADHQEVLAAVNLHRLPAMPLRVRLTALAEEVEGHLGHANVEDAALLRRFRDVARVTVEVLEAIEDGRLAEVCA